MFGFKFDINNFTKRTALSVVVAIILFIIGFFSSHLLVNNDWREAVGTVAGLSLIALYLRIGISIDERRLAAETNRANKNKASRFVCLRCGADSMEYECDVTNDSENGWQGAITYYAGKWLRFRCSLCHKFRDVSPQEAKRIRGSDI